MKLLLIVPALLAGAFLSGAPLLAAEACCGDETASAQGTAPKAAAPVGHPLRGVVVAVLADKSALLVNHEEIPGVMAAMTMLLKVDADTLAAARKNQAITGTLVKKADGWWLENLAPVAAETAAPKA